MADVYPNRISRADTNIILDSILTYYTDMSEKQIMNDDNCSFTTLSDRLTQNDDNYSPSIMKDPIAIKDIGEFPLPPRIVHTTPHNWRSGSPKVGTYPPEPTYNVATSLRKTPCTSPSPAKYVLVHDPSFKVRNTPQLFEGAETYKPIISKCDYVSRSFPREEHQQPLIEHPMMIVDNAKSRLGEKNQIQDSFSKKPLSTGCKLDKRQDPHEHTGSSKNSLAYTEKPFTTQTPGGQQTVSYDGSVSSTGPSQGDSAFVGPQNVPLGDITNTGQISKLPRNREHSPGSSAGHLSHHKDSLDRSIHLESTNQSSYSPAEDSISERTTSPVLPLYDILQQQFSDLQTTQTNNARLSYISLSSKMGSLNLSSTSLDDSERSDANHHVEDFRSSICDFPSSDRDQFWSSQDLLLHSSAYFKIDPTVPDRLNSGEILQGEQPSLTKQDSSAEDIRNNRDTCAGTAEIVEQRELSDQFQTQNLPHGVGSMERRHADALLLSPQPQRLFSSFIYGESPEIDLFEDRKIEDVTQSTSEETDAPFPSQDSAQESTHGKDEHPDFRNRHNTPHHSKMTWPLPSYRIVQGGTRQRSCTQPGRLSSCKWDAYDGLEVQPDPNGEAPSTLTNQIASEAKFQPASEDTRSFDNKEAIYECGTTPAIIIPRSRYEPESRSIYTLKHPKPLPALPEELDTSAIITFPLSREMPLPEFLTAETTSKRPALKTASSLSSLLSTKRSFSMPMLDARGTQSVPVPTEQSTMITEEENLSSMIHNRISGEQDVQDACVVRSDNADVDSHIQKHRWNTSSWGVGARLSLDDRSVALQQVTRERKPPKGCGIPWRQFWRSLSCSKPKRRISISKSSMKT